MVGILILDLVVSLLCYYRMKKNCKETYKRFKKDGYTIGENINQKKFKLAMLTISLIPVLNAIISFIIGTATHNNKEEAIKEFEHTKFVSEKSNSYFYYIIDHPGPTLVKSSDSKEIDSFIEGLGQNVIKMKIKEIQKYKDVKNKEKLKNTIKDSIESEDVKESLDEIRRQLNIYKDDIMKSVPVIEFKPKKVDKTDDNSTPTLNVDESIEEYSETHYMNR